MSTKESVLTSLEANRSASISGQELAASLGISRTAVWKAIKSLKEDGHIIDSLPGGGYRLLSQSDIITRQSIEIYLRDDLKNIDIYSFDTLDSTNNLAKKMAGEGAENFTLIIADEQSSGRGRYGKSFFSPGKSGIYMSLILKPTVNMNSSQMITIYTAVGVCKAIEKLTDYKPSIKWVNDIFLEGKKICGILTEATVDFESGSTESIIVGIGINFKSPLKSFPKEIESIAGAIDCNTIRRSMLVAEIINELQDAYSLLFQKEGSLDPSYHGEKILEEYRKRSFLIGMDISYSIPGKGNVNGIATEINESGNLVVIRSAGQRDILTSGEVSVRVRT